MMGLVVPLFVSALVDVSSSSSQQRRIVHNHVLQQLMQIGPKYPAAFKTIMQSSPPLKQKLESAIRASQSPSKTNKAPARPRTQQQAPSIKLKMDFSNFK